MADNSTAGLIMAAQGHCWLTCYFKGMIIKDFFTGLLIYTLYVLRLTPAGFNEVYQQRKDACSDCPLRSGTFCSKYKSVQILKDEFLLTLYKNGIVWGCGCFLPFKRATNSKCPLGRWETFQLK